MLRSQKGFGLILMIILIAVAAIMIGGVTACVTNAAFLSALRVNQARAYHLAQGAVMQAFKDFDDSFDTDDLLGSYRPLTTNTGNEYLNTNFQSNFAYFMTDTPSFNDEWWPSANPPVPNPPSPTFPAAPNLYCNSDRVSMNYRLHGWTVWNIRVNDTLTTNDNLVVTGVKVWWTGADTLGVSRIRLNSSTEHTIGGATVFAGTAAKGTLINISGVSATYRTLTPGQAWTGPCTYIQWNGAMPDNSRVTMQLTFSDTSTSHEVVLWDGLLNGTGRPHLHTFSITGTGEVRMAKFGVLKKVRGTFSYAPMEYDHEVRLLAWENLDP